MTMRWGVSDMANYRVWKFFLLQSYKLEFPKRKNRNVVRPVSNVILFSHMKIILDTLSSLHLSL
jgi:hypothetical protein